MFTDLKNVRGNLSNKPFLIWLLTTPPYFKHVATLPWKFIINLLISDINVSQYSVQHMQGVVGF